MKLTTKIFKHYIPIILGIFVSVYELWSLISSSTLPFTVPAKYKIAIGIVAGIGWIIKNFKPYEIKKPN